MPDVLVLDLEDGVAQTAKDAAREHLRALLNARARDPRRSERDRFAVTRPEWMLRINPSSDLDNYAADLDCFLPRILPEEFRGGSPGPAAFGLPDSVILPKLEQLGQLTELQARLQRLEGLVGRPAPLPVVALVESPAALVGLPSLLRDALPRLQGLVFGSDDYAAAAGLPRGATPRAIAWARQSFVATTSAYGLQAIDVVYKRVRDLAGLADDLDEGYELGFTGKQLIHPSQIGPTHTAFQASPEELTWARDLLTKAAQYSATGIGTFEFQGEMIDMPLFRKAYRILQMAGEDPPTASTT